MVLPTSSLTCNPYPVSGLQLVNEELLISLPSVRISLVWRHGFHMSRVCDFRETTTGHPCKNVVEDRHDHCEAGHPCPPLATEGKGVDALTDILQSLEIEDCTSSDINHDDDSSREFWVKTASGEEVGGPYRSRAAAIKAMSEHSIGWQQDLQVVDEDDCCTGDRVTVEVVNYRPETYDYDEDTMALTPRPSGSSATLRPVENSSDDSPESFMGSERRCYVSNVVAGIESRIEVPRSEAELVGSRRADSDQHLPILTLDYEARLLPSKSGGHFHLYLNRPVTWEPTSVSCAPCPGPG